VHLAGARRAQQLDLQPVQRDRDVALAGDLLVQPVGELVGPGRRVEVAGEPVADRRDPLDLLARRPAQRGPEDVGLGREVPGGRGQRDASLRRQPPVRDGGDALARADPDRRRDDRVADPLGSAPRTCAT
jgi:hypothetical protein